MLSIAVGQVFIDALVLSLILYLMARHEADYDFQKLAMVVAGTALGNMVLSVSLGLWLPPALSVWIMPLVQIVFSAYMIMTFCWISFRKSLLVAVVFACLHIGFGFVVNWAVKRMFGSAGQQPSLVERQNQEIEDVRKEMMRMAEIEAKAYAPPTPPEAVAPKPAAVVVSNAAPAATNPPPAPPAAVVAGEAVPPSVAVPAGTQAEWDAARARVKYAGSSGQGGGYVALINKRLVEPGDLVSVSHQGKTYRWRVKSITRDGVDLEPVDVR